MLVSKQKTESLAEGFSMTFLFKIHVSITNTDIWTNKTFMLLHEE